MKLHKILLLLFLIFISCRIVKKEKDVTSTNTHLTEFKFPKQVGFVNDFERIFTRDEVKFLENILSTFQKDLNKEIALVTLKSIPENIDFDQYAIRMSGHWQIGKNNDGNGLTIVLSKKLKRTRISTTGKTKKLHLSDDFCQKVIDKIMIPEFKKENYNDGNDHYARIK